MTVVQFYSLFALPSRGRPVCSNSWTWSRLWIVLFMYYVSLEWRYLIYNQIKYAVMICTVQAQTESYLWLFALEMILAPISLLVTAHVCFAYKSAVDKRLLISDQTVLHESITKLQAELQQLKAEVEQLKQSKSGQYSVTHLLGFHSHWWASISGD